MLLCKHVLRHHKLLMESSRSMLVTDSVACDLQSRLKVAFLVNKKIVSNASSSWVLLCTCDYLQLSCKQQTGLQLFQLSLITIFHEIW